jgi:hypothetical protein
VGYYKATVVDENEIWLDHNLDADGEPGERIIIESPPVWMRTIEKGAIYTITWGTTKIDTSTFATQPEFPTGKPEPEKVPPYPKTLITLGLARAEALDAEIARMVEVTGDQSIRILEDLVQASRLNQAYKKLLGSLPVE